MKINIGYEFTNRYEYTNSYNRIIVALTLIVWLVPLFVFAQNMSSTNFSIDGGTITGGGTANISSTNFGLAATFGESAIGSVSSTNFQTESGFQPVVSSTVSSETPTPTPTPTPTVSAGSGGGGGSGVSGGVANHVTSLDASLSIIPIQSGTLTQNLSAGHVVKVVIPRGSVPVTTIIAVTENLVVGAEAEALTSANVALIGNRVFRVTAQDSIGNPVAAFSPPITIVITIPGLPADTSDLGLYFLDTAASVWRLIPDVVFRGENVIFSVDHLTDFAIFQIPGRPLTIATLLAIFREALPSILPAELRDADINQDGKVDILDFNILMVNWRTPLVLRADITVDGVVDIFDFNIMMVQWSG